MGKANRFTHPKADVNLFGWTSFQGSADWWWEGILPSKGTSGYSSKIFGPAVFFSKALKVFHQTCQLFAAVNPHVFQVLY